MLIFAIVVGLIGLYAVYSLIGYAAVEISYPVLRSDNGTAYFGGNLIMLGVAASVLLVCIPAEAVLIRKLVGKTHRVNFGDDKQS